jgi:VRR-NUC domain
MTAWRQLDLLKDPRRQRGTRPPPALEVATHIALADTLRKGGLQPGWIWSHIGHGGKRSEETGRLLKRMGLAPGIPDFLFIAPDGRHHWLELKRGRAPLTDAQKKFQLEMNMRGVPCGVARSYQDAICQLTEWGAVRVKVAA